MCRSIKTLRPMRPEDTEPTEDEVQAAARQFVKKLSGFQRPSRANEDVFETAVTEVAAAASRLLDGLVSGRRPPAAE